MTQANEMRLRLALGLILLILASACALKSPSTHITLVGHVENHYNVGIEGMRVTLATRGEILETSTDKRGGFTFHARPAPYYLIAFGRQVKQVHPNGKRLVYVGVFRR